MITVVLGIIALLGLTAGLNAARDDVSIALVFLLYISLVVAVSLGGGTTIGIASAVVAFFVVNWFFTEPYHTLSVADPERVAELLIFLTVSAIVAVLVDTATRRQVVIEQTSQESERLVAANELRSTLLRAVSHDLRTPLATAKLSTSSLLAQDVELASGDRRELLELADSELDRLIGIVENLLDAGRLQAGVLTATMVSVRLTEVLESAVASLGSTDRRRVLAEPNASDVIHTDQALLTRVLGNLVSNALAADPAGMVTIRTRHDGSVHVEVIDHGPGIPADQRDDVLRPFYRHGDGVVTGGAGLGLAICVGFCEAIGAELVLEDTPGGGLTARVTLPDEP